MAPSRRRSDDEEPLVVVISHTRRRPLYWIDRIAQGRPP